MGDIPEPASPLPWGDEWEWSRASRNDRAYAVWAANNARALYEALAAATEALNEINDICEDEVCREAAEQAGDAATDALNAAKQRG